MMIIIIAIITTKMIKHMGRKMSTKSTLIKIIIETKITKSIRIKIKNINNRMHRMSRINIIEMIKIISQPVKMMIIQNLEKLVIKFNLKIFNRKMRIKMKRPIIFKSREAIEIRNRTFKIKHILIIKVDQTPKIINRMCNPIETTKNNKIFRQTTNFISQKAKTYHKK